MPTCAWPTTATASISSSTSNQSGTPLKGLRVNSSTIFGVAMTCTLRCKISDASRSLVFSIGPQLVVDVGIKKTADFRLRGETPGSERPPDESRLAASPYAAGRVIFRVAVEP